MVDNDDEYQDDPKPVSLGDFAELLGVSKREPALAHSGAREDCVKDPVTKKEYGQRAIHGF